MQARNRTWLLGSDPVERCRQRTMAIEGGDGSTLSLDFTTMGGVLDPRLTFTRASTVATYINSSGYVATATTNEPRFDYSPTNIGEPRGLLIEGQGINVLKSSEEFSIALGYAEQDIVVPRTSGTSPSGGTAVGFYPTTASGYHRVQSPYLTGLSGAYTVSIWYKRLNSSLRAGINANAMLNVGAVFDLNGAGSVVTLGGSAANKAATITAYPNDWYRVTVTGTRATDNGLFFFMAGSTQTDFDGGTPFVGVASQGMLMWGAQLEAGSGASSYIPTGASQVTRNADYLLSASSSGAGRGSEFSLDDLAPGTSALNQHTVLWTYGRDPNSKREYPASLYARTNANTVRIDMRDFSGTTAWVATQTRTVQNVNVGTASKLKIALSQSTSAYPISAINGTSATFTSGVIDSALGLQWVQLGNTSMVSGSFNPIWAQNLKVYPTALTAAQLQEITQPTYVAPTLDLDFRSGVLDSRFTHTRGSNATFVNSLGYVDWAGSNVILFSETLEIGTGKWTVVGTASVSIDSAVSTPNGNLGTAKVTGTTAGSHRVVSNAIQMNRQRHTLTMWLRGGTSLMTNIGVYDGTNWCPFVATIVSGPGTITFNALQVIISGLTTAWTKIQIVLSPVTDSAFNVLIYPDNNGTSKDVYIWGVQINPGSTAQTYYPTTTTAYYGPRFDYSSTKIGQANGLLIESQSINYLTYSNSFTVSAGWNVVSNLNTTAWTGFTAPDQSTNAVRLVANGTNGSHRIEHIDISGLSNNTQYTVSVWCKPDGYPRLGITTSNSNARRNFDPASNASTGYGTSSTGSIVEFPGGWYRCSMTFTTGAANTPFGVWLSVHKDDEDTITSWVGNNMGGIQVWGVQVEAGSGATSYIPTGATAGGVTRTADNCYMSGISSWFNASQGTFITNCTYNSSAGDNNGIEISVGTGSSASNRIGIRKGYVDYYSGGGSAQAEMYPTVTSGTVRIGTAYLVNDFAMCSNGGTMRADGSGAVPVGLNTLKLYADSGSITLSGTLQSFTYYPIRLSNNQLLSLTTL